MLIKYGDGTITNVIKSEADLTEEEKLALKQGKEQLQQNKDRLIIESEIHNCASCKEQS